MFDDFPDLPGGVCRREAFRNLLMLADQVLNLLVELALAEVHRDHLAAFEQRDLKALAKAIHSHRHCARLVGPGGDLGDVDGKAFQRGRGGLWSGTDKTEVISDDRAIGPHRAVEQALVVELRVLCDAVHRFQEVLDFHLIGFTQHGIVDSTVGCMQRDLLHLGEDVVDLGQPALCGLDQRDRLLRVLEGLPGAHLMRIELIGRNQCRRSLHGCVDTLPGTEFFDAIGHPFVRVVCLPEGTERKGVVENLHGLLPR